jgi:hypothetical protein
VSEKGFAERVEKALNLKGLEGVQIVSEKDFLKRQDLTKPSDEKEKPNCNLHACFDYESKSRPAKRCSVCLCKKQRTPSA